MKIEKGAGILSIFIKSLEKEADKEYAAYQESVQKYNAVLRKLDLTINDFQSNSKIAIKNFKNQEKGKFRLLHNRRLKKVMIELEVFIKESSELRSEVKGALILYDTNPAVLEIKIETISNRFNKFNHRFNDFYRKYSKLENNNFWNSLKLLIKDILEGINLLRFASEKVKEQRAKKLEASNKATVLVTDLKDITRKLRKFRNKLLPFFRMVTPIYKEYNALFPTILSFTSYDEETHEDIEAMYREKGKGLNSLVVDAQNDIKKIAVHLEHVTFSFTYFTKALRLHHQTLRYYSTFGLIIVGLKKRFSFMDMPTLQRRYAVRQIKKIEALLDEYHNMFLDMYTLLESIKNAFDEAKKIISEIKKEEKKAVNNSSITQAFKVLDGVT